MLEEYLYSNGERAFSGMRESTGRRMVAPEGVPAGPLMYSKHPGGQGLTLVDRRQWEKKNAKAAMA